MDNQTVYMPPNGGNVVTRQAHLADRTARIARIGAQVQSRTYEPPLEGVVESLVVALLPHFGFQR